MGYIRTKTRPQGDRAIQTKQDNFGQGLNVDIPASDFDNNANQNLENYIAFERFTEGRSGSLLIQSLPGSGTVHSIKIHPTENVCILHRGTKIFQLTSAGDTEIKSFLALTATTSPVSFGINKPSELKPFGKNFLISTEDGLFQILIEYTNNSFFQMNSGQPLDTNDFVSTGNNEIFKNYITYTFSIIVDETTGLAAGFNEDRFTAGKKLIWESPPVIDGNSGVDNASYFNLRAHTGPLGQGVGFASIIIHLGAQDIAAGLEEKITHMSVYQTPDVGENGFNNLNFEQFCFSNDIDVDHADYPNVSGSANQSDTQCISRLKTANLRLRTTGFEALPSGDILGISPGFIFTALEGGKTLHYSQRIPNDTIVGFNNPGVQFHEYDDGITVLANTPDFMSVMTNKTSNYITLTSFENVGVFESVFVLTHFADSDDTFGVSDRRSFVKIEDGSYMAICSDKSVRVWDGNGWSRDVAENRVRSIIERIVEGSTIGGYYRGAYFIWFKVDNGASTTDVCMRFSVKRESGKGWSFYTGDDWITAGAETVTFNGPNYYNPGQPNNEFFFAVDAASNNIYWIETFYGPDNLTIAGRQITKYWNDKTTSISDGTSIICKIRTRDEKGSKESFNIKHSESHAYLRDIINPGSGVNIPAPPISTITYESLLVDAIAFVDGSQVRVETAGRVKSDGDIQFWYKVEGSRIAIEFQTNRSGHQLVGIDGRFRVQDILRPNRGPATTVAADFQTEIVKTLKEWHFSRPRPFLDRTRQTIIPSGLINTTVGPDGRSLAVQVGSNTLSVNRFRKVSKKIYTGEFTISLWVSGITASNTVVVQFQDATGTANFTLSATTPTSLTILEGSGSVTVDDLGSGPVNNFHQLILVRTTGSDVRVYQNNTLKGTLTFAGSFGGGFFQMGGEP